MSKTVVWVGCAWLLAGLGCAGSEPMDGSGSPDPGVTGPSGAPTGAGGSVAAGTGAPVVGPSGAAAGSMAVGGTAGSAPTAIAGSGSLGPTGEGGATGVAGAGPVAPGSFDYENEDVALSASLMIAAGETVRVGPGTTFTASGAEIAVQVAGTLIVSGSAEAPVEFLGAGTPRSWHGIVIASGGRLELTHAKIGGATFGIHAEPGSSYAVDHAEIGTSFKVAVLFADGSFANSKFHASGDDTFSPVNEVGVEDVNGTMTIIDASPTVTNSSFDNSSPLVDMIRIGGTGAPVFDHVSVVGAHCGFHPNGGVNTAPTIRNTVLQGLSYGIMAYTSKPKFENNNFMENSADIGFCFGATADNAPTLTNNFYSSGSALFDPSCIGIGAPDSAPAAAAHADAGPTGL